MAKDLSTYHIPTPCRPSPIGASAIAMPYETTPTHSPRLQLLDMLQYKRPAGSKSERKFINRFIRPLGVYQDAIGNLIKAIPCADGTASPVLWSSHTDTVHRHGGRQSLTIVNDIAKAPASDCLGADCTTGVWLMVNMIARGIPGLYVFHRMEEVGGIGSSHIAKETPELLAGINYAIAFDRYGTTSVITHQGSRCCSNAFADSLIDQLGAKHWQRDDGGTFTDTANYTDLIAECTNISVGYYNQHRSSETQDIGFALDLLETICDLDHATLVCERIAGTTEYDNYGVWSNRYYQPGMSGYSGRRTYDSTGRSSPYSSYDFTADDDYDIHDATFSEVSSALGIHDDTKPFGKDTAAKGTAKAKERDLDYMIDLASQHPDAVAMLMQDYGITSEDILAFIYAPATN